jgi:putative transferase (TIGR04331 family)
MNQQYYLCTTGISEIWDVSCPLLLLGPWCLMPSINKDLLAEKSYQLIPSPFVPAIQIKYAADYCFELSKSLLPQLTRELNSLHQVDYPQNYWKTLLLPWLVHFTGVFYDRFKRIEQVLIDYPRFNTNVLSPDDCDIRCRDIQHFMLNQVNDDYYNLKLFSIIIQYLCKGQCNHISISRNTKELPVKQMWYNSLFDYILNKYCFNRKTSKFILSDMYHLSKIDCLTLNHNPHFKMLWLRNFSATSYKGGDDYCPGTRKGIVLTGAPDNFSQLLFNIIPLAIPVCYIENYKSFHEVAMRDLKTSPLAAGSSIGWYYNERLKFYLAESTLYGAQLVDFQHGGGYGISLAAPTESISMEKDTFYTWGWKSDENTVPLPSPHLSKIRNTAKKGGNHLLMVGAGVPRYHYRFDSGLQCDNMLDYMAYKEQFLQCLSNPLLSKLLYRPYNDYGWGEKELVQKIHPMVRFAVKGKLTNLMKKARLVVIDHPHTSYLEALIINVPTVLFWDYNVHLVRAEAEPYFQMLKDAEILFNNPKDAAYKINQVFDNPKEWWQSTKVQKARLSFCDQFALSSENWKKEWAQAFSKLVE